MLRIDEPLETDRLLLRPFRTDDVDALHDLRTCEDVLRYLYWPPATIEQTRHVIAQRLSMNTLSGENDSLVLAVEERSTGRMIGEVDLRWLSVEHRQGEVGAILHPRAQGRGFATETVSALLDLAFTRLGLKRVTAQTNAHNAASIRALHRLGMRQEGHLRQCVHFAGTWHDELLFAILAEEWASRAPAGG
ncbi:GNAT family N-acetyltransferase [Micromonospora echinospora]|uniref:GNAT family N-acetyltransferase n=1 Tax=Micromonospora echinospora TaxID=1877 RepID=UPI003A8A7EDE